VKDNDVTSFYRPEWFNGINDSSILLSVYSVPTFKSNDLPADPIIYDFHTIPVRAIITYQSFNYPDIGSAIPIFPSPKAFRVDNNKIRTKQTPRGVYLALTAPQKVNGLEHEQPQIMDQIHTALSLIISIIGQSAAFTHVFDYVFNLDSSGFMAFSQSHANPWIVGRPSLTKLSFKSISFSERALASMPRKLKHQVQLSLRWVRMAVYDSGIDAFLKYWIALETLSMPDTSNIAPLKSILAEAYLIPFNDVDRIFGIGRIYDFRCDVVHDGLFVNIDLNFLYYFSCLYSDILYSIIGLPNMRKAKAWLDDPVNGGLEELLTKTRPTKA
jgi:hypothetical protein